MHSLHYAVAQTRRAVERGYFHKVTYLHKVTPLATIGESNGQSVKGWCGGWHAGQGEVS